jgi:DNA polymerase-1
LRRLAFDIETDGLLDELTKLHCLVIKDLDTGEAMSCASEAAEATRDRSDHLSQARDRPPAYRTIEDGLSVLAEADLLTGHNVVKFDLPALLKVYGWSPKPGCVIRDTLIMARVVWPDIKSTDLDPKTKRSPPGNLKGRYSLEAFGYRLGEYKGDYKGGWDKWSPEMQSYAEQDVEVTARLFEKLHESMAEQTKPSTGGKAWSGNAIDLEHRVQEIIAARRRTASSSTARPPTPSSRSWPAAGRSYSRTSRASSRPGTSPRAGVHRRSCRLWHADENGTEQSERKRKGEPACSRRATTRRSPRARVHPRRASLVQPRVPLRCRRQAHQAPRVEARGVHQGRAPGDRRHRPRPSRGPEAQALAEYFLVEKRLGAIAEGKEAWLKA